MISRYRSRVSGPLLDRIDIHIDVPAVPYKELSNEYSGEKSESIRKRVIEAREIQLKRFKDDKIFANGQMKTRHMKKYCKLTEDAHAGLGYGVRSTLLTYFCAMCRPDPVSYLLNYYC